MLDIKFIRENKELIKKNNINRHVNVDVDLLLELDVKNRELIREIDSKRAELKSGSKTKPTPEVIERLKKLGDDIKTVEEVKNTISVQLQDLHLQIPNITHPDSPQGKDDSENVQIEQFGEATQFDFEYKDHVDIGKDLDIIDFEKAAEVSGQGFYYFKGKMVLLEQALTTYTLNKLIEKGFTPISTPDLARSFAMTGTGFNPRGNEDQIYEIEGEDLSLIATSEITVGAYLSNTILDEKELDKKYVGISHCYRKEAGAYGKESKGLYRVHQFTKVEMFIFSHPDRSDEYLQELRAIEQEIYVELGIPFRVVDICTGDMGGPAYKKYDLEAWMPMKNGWGEITSCSNCTNYQARRLNIKYRKKDGKTEYVHTLNGTAMTSSRIPLAILENFQQADGSIKIPEVLQKYTGFEFIKK